MNPMGERLTHADPVKKERVLGQLVHAVSKAQAANAVVAEAIRGGTGAYVCLTNVHTTVESRRSPELRAAADNALLSLPDGMPLTWILRRRGHEQTEKVTGIEYVPLVAQTGVSAELRHFFYGGAQGVARDAARRLKSLVPGVNVVGALSPPYGDVQTWPVDELRDEIQRTRPHILWVGLGAPKQDLWMQRMSPILEVPVMVGVGAGIDYLAGAKRAAPTVLRHIGLEWLFRLAAEPRRLWRRYLVGNSTFLVLLAREALVERFGRPEQPAERPLEGLRLEEPQAARPQLPGEGVPEESTRRDADPLPADPG
jgi:N-acetylglucosaminyldiphosphoundecaprenol N-acetyl-beta-D-mannosaminyltransferase